jgi:hypothetical protein
MRETKARGPAGVPVAQNGFGKISRGHTIIKIGAKGFMGAERAKLAHGCEMLTHVDRFVVQGKLAF